MKTRNGEWSAKDGVLRLSATVPNVTAFVGDTSWTNYTITRKAKNVYPLEEVLKLTVM